MLVIFDCETPGAFSASIDWRMASSSATQEDMTAASIRFTVYFSDWTRSCVEKSTFGRSDKLSLPKVFGK